MHYFGFLIATIFPPVIVAILRRTANQSGIWSHYQSPMCLWGPDELNFEGKWTNTGQPVGNPDAGKDASFLHAFDLLMIIKISLAKFKFNVLPGLYFTDAYGTEGNPKNAPNAVTLNNSGNQFQSKATITVKTKSKDVDFTTLELKSESLTINISSGTIKNAGNDLQTTSPNLTKDTVLDLNGTGSLSGGSVSGNVPVTLKGIIVVTSSDQPIGKNTLTITGSGTSNGVSGSLNLTNGTGNVSITAATSTLTINKEACDKLTEKTATYLKIGSSNSTARNPTEATGDAQTLGLNTEESFKKYWHLLPPNNI
uniref:Uncharacterized protein n=1 Tax=Theileria annulata TaxID=5874 RepID=A0A3B0NAP5_THEAN